MAVSKLGMAIAYAADQHSGQTDRNGEPYLLHCIRVLTAVRNAGFSEDHQVVAVLHDVLEDSTIADDLSVIEYIYGVPVANGLDAMTRRFKELAEDHPDYLMVDNLGGKIWGDPLETHWEYFQRCVQDPIGRVVKYFDTLDNADPKRYTPGVPLGRYIKVLDWYAENGKPEV